MTKKLFSKPTNPIKNLIFIVEDNEVYAKSLQTFIQTRFRNRTEIKLFRVGEMCLMEMHRNPNIVIMDYFLNSKYEEAHNGLEIIKRIKVLKPQTNIIVLSSQDKFNISSEAIKKHDCSYVQKGQEAFNKVEQMLIEIFHHQNPLEFEPMN